MTSRRVLITGANSGIGLSTATILASRGDHVTITCRSRDKALAAIAKIKQTTPAADVDYCLMDLADFHSVLAAVDELAEKKPFDVMILNAGAMFPDPPVTDYGIEAAFQINCLSHYLFSTALLARRPQAHKCHVVCLSSVLIKMCGNWPMWRVPKSTEKWQVAFASRGLSSWREYALSKWAMAVLAGLLARLDNVSAVAVNPGNSHTDVTRNMPKGQKKALRVFKNTLITVDQAAANVIRGAEGPIKDGRFYDQHKQAHLPKHARSDASIQGLHTYCESLLDEHLPSRHSPLSSPAPSPLLLSHSPLVRASAETR